MEKEGCLLLQIRSSFRQKKKFGLLSFGRVVCVFTTTPELFAYVNRAMMLTEQQMSSTLGCK